MFSSTLLWYLMVIDHTSLCSDPTTDATPIGADFYENSFLETTTWDDYGPYGFLKPVHNVSGKGYFHCFGENNTVVEVATGAEYGGGNAE